MCIVRMCIVRGLAGFAALALAATSVWAQYPNPSRPITLVAPFSAGGDSDLSARNLAQHAPKYLNGTPLVVVNRVGASGAIGSQFVRAAPPDGYTLLLARIGSQAINPALDSKLPYKWNDFTFLSVLELNPVACVVKADAPYRTAGELVDYLRRNPGKTNYSSAGSGTLQHMAPHVLFSIAGLRPDVAVHIPFKGGGDLVNALLGGQVQFVCTNMTTLISHMRAGTLRGVLLAMPERIKEIPDVPTAREVGLAEMEKVVGWSALYGPPALPNEVVEKWAEVMANLARDPDWLAGNAKIGGVPAVRSPAETARFAREQYELYERLGTALGLKQ